MRRRRVLAGALLAGLLTGCATGPTLSPLDTESHWSGRLALTVMAEPPQHFSALFELHGNVDAGEIRLTSPFGQLMGIARWSAHEAELIRGHERQSYPDMHELTSALTGTPLPMAPLFDWLSGRPMTLDGWEADLSRYTEGRISAQRLQPSPPVQLRIILQ